MWCRTILYCGHAAPQQNALCCTVLLYTAPCCAMLACGKTPLPHICETTAIATTPLKTTLTRFPTPELILRVMWDVDARSTSMRLGFGFSYLRTSLLKAFKFEAGGGTGAATTSCGLCCISTGHSSLNLFGSHFFRALSHWLLHCQWSQTALSPPTNKTQRSERAPQKWVPRTPTVYYD